MRWVYTYHFFIEFVLSKIKISNTIFLAMKINSFLTLINLRTENLSLSTVRDVYANGQETQTGKKSFNILFYCR